MDCPQTEIETYERKITNIRKYGCCAFCTIWAVGLNPINKEAVQMLINGIDTGALDTDCTVNWKPFTKLITGKNYNVEMIDLPSEKQTIETLKNYKGKIIVRFDKGINYHWVGYEDGKLAFNSLKYSNCAENGRPTKIRILTEI